MHICRFQNVVRRCPAPRLHCFLSYHWPSFRFLSFMAFLIPSIQFFFGLPRALFCFGIHFNVILGNLPPVILWTWPYHVSWFCSFSFTIGSSDLWMNYGTWNVQGIRGKMEEITSELGQLKIDVIGLTETKRKNTCSEIVGGYVNLYSGQKSRKRSQIAAVRHFVGHCPPKTHSEILVRAFCFLSL